MCLYDGMLGMCDGFLLFVMIDADEWMRRFIGWDYPITAYSMSHFNENKGLFVYTLHPPKKGLRHLKGHKVMTSLFADHRCG